MITLTPNSTPVDISHALDILRLVSDPEACKQRLAELQDAADKANLASDKAAKMQADVTQRLAVSESSARNLAADKASFEKISKQTEDRHQQDQKALDDESAALNRRKLELSSLAKSLSQREATLVQQEQDMRSREAAVGDREAAASAKQADYEGKLAKLSAAMGIRA